MPGTILYSANPWFSTEIARRYRGGNFFAWVSDYFDTELAPAGSAGAFIAPSSNPRRIYEEMLVEYNAEEEHSRTRGAHRKTFSRLARRWLGNKELTEDQYGEIIASVRAPSWRIWKPVLYVVPRTNIDATRIKEVRRNDRAGYGPEYQIFDLRENEFDIVDLSGLVRKR
jgi:hypothetical protein